MVTFEEVSNWMDKFESESITLRIKMSDDSELYVSGDYKDVVLCYDGEERTLLDEIEFWELDKDYVLFIQPSGMPDLVVRLYLNDIESIEEDKFDASEWEEED